MTGGAFGSMLAQFVHLTSAERKGLLVAGAAGGMSATFASPVGATLLAVELLLFEWKPRRFIPVALASATAAALRHYIIGPGPLFPVLAHAVLIGPKALFGLVLVHRGRITLGATHCLCLRRRRCFRKLPIHWMWWPALGGVVVGLGGLVFPQALGVGYGVIADLVGHNIPGRLLLGILLVKWVYLGGSPGLWHLRGCSRAVADDGRRTRRFRVDVPAERRHWVLAVDQHGGSFGRNDAVAFYRDCVCSGTYAQRKYAVAIGRGGHDRSWFYSSDHAALHPDGEREPTRLPFESGICCRLVGSSFCPRCHEDEHRGTSLLNAAERTRPHVFYRSA